MQSKSLNKKEIKIKTRQRWMKECEFFSKTLLALLPLDKKLNIETFFSCKCLM